MKESNELCVHSVNGWILHKSAIVRWSKKKDDLLQDICKILFSFLSLLVFVINRLVVVETFSFLRISIVVFLKLISHGFFNSSYLFSSCLSLQFYENGRHFENAKCNIKINGCMHLSLSLSPSLVAWFAFGGLNAADVIK